MNEIKYEDFKLPNYINNSTAVVLTGEVDGETKSIRLTLSDVVLAAELAGLNMLFVSDTGRGKTQLLTDIAWSHFSGDQKEGNANLADGRPGFEIEDLFVRQKVDLGTGVYDSDQARQLKEDRIGRLLHAVDEINRAPKPKQNEFFDLADNKYTFNGTRYKLGRNNYGLFIATANLNRLNGDFAGTFEMDRALLNRAHLTIDLDHPSFRPTVEDEMEIEERKANPRVDVAEPKDLSEQILEINAQIREQAGSLNPYMTAFRFIIGRGLDYCDKETDKDKTTRFPMLCGECDFAGKELCSLVKGSSERTIPAVKSLAYALAYVVELKLGKKVEIDPFDAALQAFKFTSYHGNLNDVVLGEEYHGRKQKMADETVSRLEGSVRALQKYIPLMVEGAYPVIVEFSKDGKEIATGKTRELLEKLRKTGISYRETSLADELKEKGIGTDWIDGYVKRFARK